MGLFDGKKGIVFGIANDRSIAWSIAKSLFAEGAEMAFTHLPDRDPERPKAERKLRKLVEPHGAKVVLACDVQDEANLDQVFETVKQDMGEIDFVLHSIAFAPKDELQGPVYDVTNEGFTLSMQISCYSLISIAKRAKEIMKPGGNILTLTYLGGEKVIPGYNLMGICKAALESTVGYLANELGPKGIRVNALSAGPLKTLSSSAVDGFSKMLDFNASFSPLRRNIEVDEVGKFAMAMMSDLGSGMTGENIHIDAGYHIMGAPPVDFQT